MSRNKPKDTSIEIDDTFIKILPQMIANSVAISKYYRAFYESLINEDFNKVEALKIVIARGLTP